MQLFVAAHESGLGPSRPISHRDLTSAFGVKRKWVAQQSPLLRSKMSSRAEEFHLRALPKPCVNLSTRTAPDVRPFP